MLPKLWFFDSVKFGTLLQQFQHTGRVESQAEQSCESWQSMSGNTSSSHSWHRFPYLLCLDVCESHIEQRLQGQFCCWLPRQRMWFMVVLCCLLSSLDVRGTEQPTPDVKRTKMASYRLKWTEYRVISHSTTKNLWEKGKKFNYPKLANMKVTAEVCGLSVWIMSVSFFTFIELCSSLNYKCCKCNYI